MGNQGFLLCVRRLQAPRLSLRALLAQVGSVCGLQGMAEGQERGKGKGTPPLKVPHLSGVSDSTGGGGAPACFGKRPSSSVRVPSRDLTM